MIAKIPEDLTVCTICSRHHFDNCPRCYGFGVRVVTVETVGGTAEEMLVPITSEEAYTGHYRNQPQACPFCGSTPDGIPTPPAGDSAKKSKKTGWDPLERNPTEAA